MINAYGYCYIFCCLKVEFFIRFWFWCHFGHLQIGILPVCDSHFYSVVQNNAKTTSGIETFERCDRWWYEDEEIIKKQRERKKTATQRGQQQQRISEWNEYAVESEFNNIERGGCVCSVWNNGIDVEYDISLDNNISLKMRRKQWHGKKDVVTNCVTHSTITIKMTNFAIFFLAAMHWMAAHSARWLKLDWIAFTLRTFNLICQLLSVRNCCVWRSFNSIQFNSVVISILLWELPIHFSCFFSSSSSFLTTQLVLVVV